MAEPTKARASLPTVPRGSDCTDALSSFGEDTSHELAEQRFTWAVDAGAELRAMTTFDLWYALNCGDLEADVRVWRLGREAWSQACDVPELACALRAPSAKDDLADRRKRTTLDYVSKPPSFGGTALESGVVAPCGLLKPPSPLDALPASLLRGPFPRVSQADLERESARNTQPHDFSVATSLAPVSSPGPAPSSPDGELVRLQPEPAPSYRPRTPRSRAQRTKLAVGVAFAAASTIATIVILLTGGSAIGSPSQAAALERSASGRDAQGDSESCEAPASESQAAEPACGDATGPTSAQVQPPTSPSADASSAPWVEPTTSASPVKRSRSVSPSNKGQRRRR